MNVAPYDARAVANFFLDLADSKSQPVTQLTLLKLVYFAHGWYLASRNRELVRQNFEAWRHGPVVKVVRDAFYGFGKAPITGRAQKIDILTGEISEVRPKINDDDKEFLKQIFNEYYGFGAWTLSDMTHEVGSPWDQLWNSSEPVGRLALRISNQEIRAHFLGLRAKNSVS